MAEQGCVEISERAKRMPPFLVMEVMERAAALSRAGRAIVHLEVGEPDFPTPPVILEAGIKALRDGHTHYTHSLGRLELREAIAAWQEREYGVRVSPERIVVTLGSSGAMTLVFAALLEADSEVLLTDPHYACYPNFIGAFGGRSVRVPVREEQGFRYDPAEVRARIGPQTCAVMLNSPANPTGIVTDRQGLAKLAEAVDGRALIVSDEIYHGLVYQDRAHSILEVCDPERAVVISGFSKRFAMTGWRLGYAILPEFLVRPVQKLQQNLFISAPDFAQLAAVAALTQAEPDVLHMCRAYDERRKILLGLLGELGLKVLVEPTGAFYVFVNVSRYTRNVFDFAFQILNEASVAVTPGVDFGPGGEGFLRLSYANSIPNIQEGVRRLGAFLAAQPVLEGA